ncbi:MAG: TCP-1/cpn60 chaperonin family protein, partial [Candidatus Gracilibacteria bacterium]|nr:TCP-1/cpn60 chaperonin family protein [Candidatus Gracilibacteria bacterium]
ALSAAQVAVEEGVVPGGGVALLRASEEISKLKPENKDEEVAFAIMKKALQEPIRRIAENAGKDASVVVDKVKAAKGALGYNAATDTFEDLVQAGIIDPLKVTRSALENAASIAAIFLTTEVAITDIPEEKPEAPAMPGGMGGMGMM